MTVTFHALWMLCALGAATFAAAAAPRPRWILATVLGAVFAGALTSQDRAPDPEVVGLLALAGALMYLFSPRYTWCGAVLGGAVAGASTGLLSLLGVPFPLAVLVIAVLLGGTVWLARARPGFAPELLREEALLVVGGLGLMVAVLPSVLDGWQAAANLNVRVEDAAAGAVPVWALSVVATSSMLGAAYAMWSRR